MSFEIPYKTLTPILGTSATYNPSEETTPMFMNGKFNELLENDKALENQINVLNNKFCSFKTFSSDSFLNGWEQYSGSELRYNKIGNIVFLFGTISGANGVLTLGTTILNLPAEFPPSSHTRIELFTNTGILIPGLIRYNTKTLELQKDANATTYHINGFYYTNS